MRSCRYTEQVGLFATAVLTLSHVLRFASLVAQLVKNLPATQETWVLSPRWEDPLEKGKAPHSSILAWRIPGTCIESDVTERLSLQCI